MRRSTWWLSLATALLAAQAQASPSVLWDGLEPGPHGIGFRVASLEEDARPSPRPLEACLWYPADSAGKRPILFQEYVDRLAKAESADEDRRRWAMGSLRINVNSADPLSLDGAKLETLAATPTMAVREAPPAAGTFPLLLWGARHSTCIAQSVLSEYLASHGYVVAAVEYRGLRPRNPWEDQDPAELLRTFETWTRDLELGLSYLRTLDFVDDEATGVLSWSYGGLSAVALVLRNPDVGAFVSLDATSWWTVEKLAQSSYKDGSRIAAPSLIMTVAGREDPTTLFDSLETEAYLLVFESINHGNFNALEGFIPEVLGISPVAPWSVSGPGARSGYRAVAEYTRRFLDVTLKKSGDGLEFGDDVIVRKKSATPRPPTDDDVLHGLRAGRVPELPEARMLDISSRLMEEARFGEAQQLLALATERFPQSADAHFERARAHLLIGETDLAGSLLRRALELDPSHEAARHALTALPHEN